MEPILKVENLTKIFYTKTQPPYTAVDNVCFSLCPGEKLAIIGESGSGKTTVVNMITRIIDATEGHVYLKGTDITEAKGRKLKEIYKTIQMVFQTPTDSFDPRRTLGDGISESLINNGMKKKEAYEEAVRLLELCGLNEEFANRYPHEVSGGQCQRAAIARALAIKPEILILDEATSALDVTVQKDILNLLNDLQQKLGISYLFICHDIALVQNFCDRVLVMYHGQIVEEGNPDEVISNPQVDYTRNLIDSVL